MSLVRTFLENRDQPIQVHLDRTVTQYHQSGPMKEPCVIASGDPDRVTSKAGRVLSGGLESLLARCVDSSVTLYQDFDVTNLMKERVVTALLDASGKVDKVQGGVITLISRTMKGTGLRMHCRADKVLFFHCEVPVDAGPGIQIEDGPDIPAPLFPNPAYRPDYVFEVLLEHKGKIAYTYVPASAVLFLATPMSIALV